MSFQPCEGLRSWYKFPTGVLQIGLAFLFASCSGQGDHNAKTTGGPGGVPLVSAGKLMVCTNVPFEPFQFNQDGRVVGFDVDIVDLAAAKLGVTQEIVIIDFAVIKSGAALNSGRCDLAAAGMTITEERQKNLDFSIPYFEANQALMTRKGRGVASLDDAKARNLRLGVVAATTGFDYVRTRGFDPVQFSDTAKQLLALDTGQIDVLVQDIPVVLTWLKKADIAEKFELVAALSTGEQYGIGIKKGNTALVNVVNESIEEALRNGAYNAIYKKWFGAEAPALKP